MLSMRIRVLWALPLAAAFALATPAAAEEVEQGAASAEAAAEGLLSAWKEKDAERFAALVPADQREGASQILEATEVREYSVEEVSEDGDVATARFTWSMEVDSDRFLELIIASAREEGAKMGASEEEIEQQIQLMEALLPQTIAQFKAHLEGRSHTMKLGRHEGRWFVTDPVEAPEQQ